MLEVSFMKFSQNKVHIIPSFFLGIIANKDVKVCSTENIQMLSKSIIEIILKRAWGIS